VPSVEVCTAGGIYFSTILGAGSLITENFIVKRKLMGPCWVRIHKPVPTKAPLSWCKLECRMESPKQLSRVDLKVEASALPPPPPVVTLSIKSKTVVNSKTHKSEIVSMSAVCHRRRPICPADPNLNNNQAFLTIRAAGEQALSLLGTLDSFLHGPIDNIYSALGQVAKEAQIVENGTANVNFSGWESVLVLILGTIVPCLLVAAAIMAQFDVEVPQITCLINWFLMPLFVLMVVLFAGVASFMIAAAAINSDFCLPGTRPALDAYPGTSPDTTVYRVLDAYGYTKADTVRQVATYYIAQCLK
jgi:hypothetical protein